MIEYLLPKLLEIAVVGREASVANLAEGGRRPAQPPADATADLPLFPSPRTMPERQPQ